jgi:hypothetical protein
MFDDWKSNMMPRGTQTPIPKKPTPKLRILLIGAAFLLGANRVAFPGIGLVPPPATDPWVTYTSRACPFPPGTPGPWEVFLFTEKDGGGWCRSFAPGLYPYSDNLGIPNDGVKSIYVGRYVRVELFKDALFAGLPRFTSSYIYGGIKNLEPPWDKQVSSMRVEIASRSYLCNDLKSGEFALSTAEGTNFFDVDCIVLPARAHDGRANQFPSSAYMGVWGRHIVEVDLRKANCGAYVYEDAGYRGAAGVYYTGYKWYPREWNLAISSIQMVCD